MIESYMENTHDNMSKKCRTKLRIRLTDPGIPDSYVCEIFDTSLENDEKISKETSKPKDYFEVLMSKKFKKISVLNTTKENTTKHSMSDEEIIQKSKRKNQKPENSVIELVHSRPEKRKLESDSSEDESLMQIQKKCQSKKLDSKLEDDCLVEITQDSTKSEKTDDKYKTRKINLSQKKTLNILNYFSKSEIGLKKVKINKKICAVQHQIKVSQGSNSLKIAGKSSKENFHDKQKKLLSSISKENVKLAPLFCKKENLVLDADQQKARLDFLFKSLPPVPKKSNNLASNNFLSFPKSLHVQQRNNSVYWSKRDVCLPLCDACCTDEYKFSCLKKFSLNIQHLTAPNFLPKNSIKLNKKLFQKVKCKYVKLDINLVIDGLKEKNEKYLAQVKEFEKFKIKTNKQGLSDEVGFEELNALWTEKYKPNSSEIIGNENVVKKLKKWLQSWKSFDEELKALVKSSRNYKKIKGVCSDSDDDFLSSENEDFDLKVPCNVCIISGPNGSGKTALVNALANELEFGILELNASSKRTGKKVLSDLQEATQSHKVHRVNLPQVGALREMKKTKSKKKRKKVKNPAKVLDQAFDRKISLILIEDADIIFEDHDEGFFSAITSLVQTSKRPLIFLSNVPDCHCLYNFKTEQCLVLKMEPPCFYKSCAVLDVVTQLEGRYFEREFLESLVCYNNFDLRKSLLDLQFWIDTNNLPVNGQKYFDLGRLWWGLSMFLYNKRIKNFVIPKIRKCKKTNDLFDSSDDEQEMMTENSDDLQKCSPLKTSIAPKRPVCSIETYCKVLDAASILDRFRLSGSSEPLPRLECKPKDSLSFDENTESLFWIRKSLSEKISNEVISLSAGIFAKKIKENKNEDRTLHYLSPSWEEIRWRNAQEKASEELSGLVSLQEERDKRSLPVDYLPILRSICRTERYRLEMNPKRRNRFYHYLNNLGLELMDENLEINCKVFSQ